MSKELIESLNNKANGLTAKEILNLALETFNGSITLASSLGAEDQVITHILSETNYDFDLFTLDTGRMFSETYDLIQRTNERYGIKIKVYFPDKEKVQKMVHEHGINLFYESIEYRKLCCGVRKVEPLKRAFEGYKAWICGLRREQSITRFGIEFFEWDEGNGLIKVNPLADWSEKQLWDFIKMNNVPYNKLHDSGFPSIGCQPCTRAVKPGEDIRAGRWWWEEPEKKECGLHNRPT